MSRKWIIAAIAAITIFFGTWYFASPWIALNGLKAAAAEGDADELRERVDFPAFRESAKTQFKARMAVELTKDENKDNPFGALGAMMAMGMIDGMVEGLLTPESISAMILQRKKDEPNNASPEAKSEDPDWAIERKGLSHFHLISKEAGANSPALLFERDGLGWTLNGIDLKDATLEEAIGTDEQEEPELE